MNIVNFERNGRKGVIYKEKGKLKVSWNDQVQSVEKVENSTVYLEDAITVENRNVTAIPLRAKETVQIKSLKNTESKTKRERDTESKTKREIQKNVGGADEDKRVQALLQGLERKEKRLQADLREVREFLRSWMSLLARNLKDLERNLVILTRKFARLEVKYHKNQEQQ